MGESSGLSYSALASRALDEAMALLAEVQFDTVRGAYRQGKLTAVSVMVEPGEEAGICHIHVMCHDPGHLGIEWDGLPLILIDRDTHEERLRFLDSRGRGEFSVEAGDEVWFGFASINHGSFASVGVPAGIFAGAAFAVAQPVWNVQGLSRDQTLSAVAELVGHGRLRISVIANSPAMRNANVQVILRSANDPSDIWLRKKLALDLGEGMRGVWSDQIGVGELQNRANDAMLVVFACK